jgi:hypothetical protein
MRRQRQHSVYKLAITRLRSRLHSTTEFQIITSHSINNCHIPISGVILDLQHSLRQVYTEPSPVAANNHHHHHLTSPTSHHTKPPKCRPSPRPAAARARSASAVGPRPAFPPISPHETHRLTCFLFYSSTSHLLLRRPARPEVQLRQGSRGEHRVWRPLLVPGSARWPVQLRAR